MCEVYKPKKRTKTTKKKKNNRIKWNKIERKKEKGILESEIEFLDI